MDWDQCQTEDLEPHCEDPHFNVRVLVYQLWIMYCSVYSIYVCRVSVSVRIYSMCVCIIHVSIQYVCLYNMYCMYSTLVLWGPTAVNDINTQCTNATSSLRFNTMTSTCRELFPGLRRRLRVRSRCRCGPGGAYPHCGSGMLTRLPFGANGALAEAIVPSTGNCVYVTGSMKLHNTKLPV